MVLEVCPACGERKFLVAAQKCTECKYGVRGMRFEASKEDLAKQAEEHPDDPRIVAYSIEAQEVPAPGETCPTCGKRMAMTKAQTQKAYRERKKREV